VRAGIDSISLNPDAIVETTLRILKLEQGGPLRRTVPSRHATLR
jgi:hypothetical protein